MGKLNNVAIIGCGNLGLSILNGLISEQNRSVGKIIATKRNIEDIQSFEELGVVVTSDNKMAVEEADIVVFALKPYKILEVISGLKETLTQDKVVVSLATGIESKEITEILVGNPVYRAMPNTGAAVSESVTCIATSDTDLERQKIVKDLFNAVGQSIYIEEGLMDSATVLGACGVAYVLRFIRAMIQGGIEIGFDAKTATDIVNQTVKGAAELLIQNENHPEQEIDKVTTPKGCTIAGLNEMEHNGFSSALIKGILTSHQKI